MDSGLGLVWIWTTHSAFCKVALKSDMLHILNGAIPALVPINSTLSFPRVSVLDFTRGRIWCGNINAQI